MSYQTNTSQPGVSPAGISSADRWREWVDRHAGTFFIAPAVSLILIFAIFPTIYSMVFALSRVRFTGDGLKFRYVGLRNFEKQFFGSSEVHFLGRTEPFSIFGMLVFAVIVVAVLWWLYRSWKTATWVRMLGALFLPPWPFSSAIFFVLRCCRECHRHTLHDTVLCSCRLFRSVRDRHRLAFLCSQPIRGGIFPGAVLYSADGHAAWRRLRDADDCRRHKGAVRAHPRCAGPSGLGLVGKPVVSAFCNDDL